MDPLRIHDAALNIAGRIERLLTLLCKQRDALGAHGKRDMPEKGPACGNIAEVLAHAQQVLGQVEETVLLNAEILGTDFVLGMGEPTAYAQCRPLEECCGKAAGPTDTPSAFEERLQVARNHRAEVNEVRRRPTNPHTTR